MDVTETMVSSREESEETLDCDSVTMEETEDDADDEAAVEQEEEAPHAGD